MSNVAIHVQNLSKQYGNGSPQAHHGMLRERLPGLVLSPLRRPASVISQDTIWALKDISFQVQRGQVVGIIGHNGAGKSTLLKILSRTTEPTQGYAEIYGRVGSLLEIGAGFHAELTGRENIYLNGAMLGMRPAGIERRFDEIVAFAEIDKYLDTPVKHYSSEMYVRLAFAIAAHLEPEILLVDQVLAVSDIAFQKKCLGRMSAVAKEGRTVLLVSHDMSAVLSLCDSAILLKSGSVSCAGKASDVVQEYLSPVDRRAATPLRERTDRTGNGLVKVVGCKICGDPSGEPGTDYLLGDDAYVVLTVHARQAASIFVGVQVKDAWGQLVFAFNSRESGYAPTVEPGESSLVLHIPCLPFLEGKYRLDATVNLVRNLEQCDAIEQVGSLVMHPKDIFGSRVPFTSRHGVVFVKHEWVRRGPAHGARATWITSA